MVMPDSMTRPGAVRGRDARVACVRAALRDDRLRLAAQPIVDVRSGETVAEELLLRFARRDGRLELPGPFIRAAEAYPLAVDLDAWVLERAVRLAAMGRVVHVNLSARAVADCSFADRVEAALHEAGANPSHITFEITETAPLLNLADARITAGRITDLGAGLALDDYGTGYGSLSYLRHLPVSMLKIDREFVAHITTCERSRAIVASIVDLASRLGLTTVAEGVEDASTLASLRTCGVDLAQGFHISLPITYDLDCCRAGTG